MRAIGADLHPALGPAPSGGPLVLSAITLASIGLAAYELAAIATRKLPAVTTLSRSRGWFLVWSWWAALGAHFLLELRDPGRRSWLV